LWCGLRAEDGDADRGPDHGKGGEPSRRQEHPNSVIPLNSPHSSAPNRPSQRGLTLTAAL
jgi:hypothetical protein